jgi:autotransporter-associated beta strand protein
MISLSLRKNIHRLITAQIIVSGGLLIASNIRAQTTIFTENVGTGGATSAYSANTWQNASPIIFSGTGDTRNNTASSGYAGVSGGRNVFLTNSGSSTLSISGIDTLNFSSFGLSFGAFKSTTASNLLDLAIGFSTSGTSGSVTFASQPTGSGTANWRLITATSAPIVGSANLSLLFTNTSTAYQIRLDDIKITGTARTAATTLVWNGAASNGNWYDGNWSGNNAPTAGISGDALQFDGGTGGATTNNVAGTLAVASLTFNSGAGAFVNSGNSLTLNGAVTNSSPNLQTINHAVVLSTGSHAVDTGGDITIGGAISGSGGGISKTGTGKLTLSSGSNSFSGPTTISQGTLALGASNVLPSSQVVLSGGTLLTSGFENTTTGSLILSSSSTINVAGAGSKLVFADSSAETWTGTLTVWNWSAGALKFGTSSAGLTTVGEGNQLSKISVFSGGEGSGQLFDVSLASDGTLVAVPEVGALFGALGLLAPLAWRERRHWMRCREARVA